MLLQSIARQLIKMDHTAGLPREKPRHTSGPSLARNPTSLSDHFFIYLTEKLHLEHGGHNKGEREEKEGDEKPGGRERTNKARNQ